MHSLSKFSFPYAFVPRVTRDKILNWPLLARNRIEALGTGNQEAEFPNLNTIENDMQKT